MMNWKVFVMGAALGFVVAVAPSCGGNKACGPANCAGCCDAADKCVASPTNANNTTCGTSGGKCEDCTARTDGKTTCSSFTCGGTGGGTGGGSGGGTGGGSGSCNSSNCGGCCSGSACIPASATSGINCGANGNVCIACGTGQNCVSGACVTPDAGSAGNVGDACSANGDCVGVPTTSAQPAFCKKNALVDTGTSIVTGYTYPGGYCTRRCTSSTQCGSTGAKCVFYLGFTGDVENVCLASCATNPCRTGYVCVNFGGSAGQLCLAAAPDGGYYEFDAGVEANDNVMGGACTTDSNCQPPASGTCIPQVLPDGGQSGFPGGSCTADCSMAVYDEYCGADAGSCVPSAYNATGGPLVLWSCERLCNPMAGTSGCRTEYYCDAIYGTQAPDYGICTPKCTNAGITCPTSTTCNTTTGVCQ